MRAIRFTDCETCGSDAGRRAARLRAPILWLAVALLSVVCSPAALALGNGQAAGLVLGQPNFTTSTLGGGAAGMSLPYGVSSDGTHFFVGDVLNNRVLIWNRMPTAAGTPADVVVGQPDLVTTAPGLEADRLYYPYGVSSDGTRLFVADQYNNRVLIWNRIPTADGVPADVVLGQPSFLAGGANIPARGAATLSLPTGVFCDGTRLFVADTQNNRVLIWNTVPTLSGTPADVVVGQPNFETGSPNSPNCNAQTLHVPSAVYSDGTRLFVSDFGNNRVLIWNVIPTNHGQSADLVLGQSDFAGLAPNNPSLGAGTLNGPHGLFFDGTSLSVADLHNNRVLLWTGLPTVNKQPANFVLGQAGFASGLANSPALGAASLFGPSNVYFAGGRLFIADYSNNRVTSHQLQPTVALAYNRPGTAFPAGPLTISATFSEVLATVPTVAVDGQGTANDVAPTAMSPTANPLVWTFAATLVSGADGLATVTIANGRSNAGYENAAATNATFTVDATGPVATLAFTRGPAVLGAGALSLTATFDEATVTQPTLAVTAGAEFFNAPVLRQVSATVFAFDLTVGATATAQAGSPYSLTLSGASDALGNAQAQTVVNGTVDTVAPPAPVLSFSRGPGFVGSGPLTVTADFVEPLLSTVDPVLTFSGAAATAGNFSTLTPVAARVSPTRFVYDVTVQGALPPAGAAYSATVAGGQDLGGNVQAPAVQNGTVQAPATLAFGALSAPANVSLGQTFNAAVVVTNLGGATAVITSTALTFSGAGMTATPAAGNVTTLAGGASSTLSFTVTAALTATPGVHEATLAVAARDDSSGADASKVLALAPGINVETQSALAFGTFTAPSFVLQGQTFNASVVVTNSGQARVNITSAALTFLPGGLTATPVGSNPSSLDGGQSATFNFEVKVALDAPAGTHTPSLAVTAVDANSEADASQFENLSPTVTVQALATLSFGPLSAPAKVSQGQTFSAAVVVTNQGQQTARITSTALTFSGTGLTASPSQGNATTLAGGVSATFNFSVTAAGDALAGAHLATLAVLAADPDSGADVSATQSLSPGVTVETPAALAFSELTAPADLAPGQTITVSVAVTNLGQAIADVVSTALTFSGSGLTATPSQANATAVAGGGSATFSFSVTAAPTATVGAHTPTLAVTAKDRNSDANVDKTQTLSPALTVREAGVPFISSGATAPIVNDVATAITLAGGGFTGVTAVRLGDPAHTVLTGLQVRDDANLSATVPRGVLAGDWDVVLTRPAGDVTVAGFKLTVTPGISLVVSVTPRLATPDTATAITLTGSGFTGATVVTLDDGTRTPLTNLRVIDDGTLTATLPAGLALGTYDFLVTTPRGTGSAGSARVTVGAGPVAAAGGDLERLVTQTVNLDGSGSTGPAGEALVYHWSLTSLPAGSQVTSGSLSDNNTSTAARPSFVPDRKGTYVLSLVVNVGGLNSAPDTVNVNIGNSTPVAVIAALPAGSVGVAMVLDGRGSSDANVEDVLTYRWSFLSVPQGSSVTAGSISPNNTISASRPSFTPDLAGSYRVALVVDDGTASSVRVEATAQVTGQGNQVPTADLQISALTGGPRLVELDGSGSRAFTPPDGNRIVTYAWSLVQKPAQAAAFSATTARARYEARVQGTYQFSLTVTDQASQTATATKSIVVDDVKPRVHLEDHLVVILPRTGAPAGLVTTAIVQLDGRLSDDANGDTISYRWSVVSAPVATSGLIPQAELTSPVATLHFPTDLDPTNTFLLGAGSYVVRLTVSDGDEAESDEFEITALDPLVLLPWADAGVNETYLVRFLSPGVIAETVPDPTVAGGVNNLRDFVRLDGHESVDPRGRTLTYRWSVARDSQGNPLIPTGAQVPVLAGATTHLPTFVPSVEGPYTFELIVNNGAFDSRRDRVTVTILSAEAQNHRPHPELVVEDLAHADPRTPLDALRSFTVGDTVQLNASTSSDRDAEDRTSGLRYQWRQLEGESVTLSPSPTAAVASFIAPSAGTYRFELTVTDRRNGASEPEDIACVVLAPAQSMPRLRLVASASTVTTTGEDAGEAIQEGRRNSLRVLVSPTVTPVVTLTATVDPGLRYKLDWTQVDGPTVVLTRNGETDTTATQVQTTFSPTTSRVHEFQALLTLLDSNGAATGVRVSRRIRVIVDTPESQVPTAVVQPITQPAPLDGTDAQRRVTLDGRGSTGTTTAGQQLSYVWEQLSGPEVEIENPYSALTRFVAPRHDDNLPRHYVFALYVDTGADRSEPFIVQVAQQGQAASAPIVSDLGGVGGGGGGCALDRMAGTATTGSLDLTLYALLLMGLLQRRRLEAAAR
ncbi:MAG: hypothetical protein HY814_03345 [Candidatus Riflebacteria bacterium]|nr:hypothetical protein [Candidatus Riflebacteria bacterium]